MEVRVVLKRVFLVLLPLTLLAGSCAYAQMDAGVKGSGAIAASQTSIGVFDVKVAKSGDVLYGGFRYAEYSSDGTSNRPMHIIYSKAVTSLTVVGGRARVQAVGFWDGMVSDLTIEVIDGAPGVDWFHIVARPRGPLTIIYDKAGELVKGDIVVFGATPTPGRTAGKGAIQVGQNVGTFEFRAQQTSTGVGGYAYYAEIGQNTSSTVRPPVRISLPAVQRISIVGRTAVFGGKGTLNGKPAQIEIKVVDNAPITPMAPVRPDEFYITATLVLSDSATPGYSAGGPLVKGDIIVVAL
jgi:hypothetical protein